MPHEWENKESHEKGRDFGDGFWHRGEGGALELFEHDAMDTTTWGTLEQPLP